MRAAPPDVLALAEIGPPEPPTRPALLDRAAALTAPLPPARPARGERKPVRRWRNLDRRQDGRRRDPPPAPAPHGLAMLSASDASPKPASPYGDLVFDGFAAHAEASAPQNVAGLRGSAP